MNTLVSHLQAHPAAIILLQETHLSPTPLPFHLQQWKGTTILSADPHSPSSQAGVAILIKESPDLTLLSFSIHIPGRAISAHVRWNKTEIWILNVYAPADTGTNRSSFFSTLPNPPIDTLPFIGGDFNCLENPSLDKIGGNNSAGTLGILDLNIYGQPQSRRHLERSTP